MLFHITEKIRKRIAYTASHPRP